MDKFLQNLFVRVISESGSALNPWAFDNTPEYHAERLAFLLGCMRPTHDGIVDCMRSKNASEIQNRFIAYAVSFLIQ